MKDWITTRNVTAKRWQDVGRHDLVQLGDELYTVVKVKDLGDDKVKVRVRSEAGDEFSSKMPAKAQAEVVELVKRKAKKWTEPDDDVEAAIVDELDGKILGVKPAADEVYIVPMVDVSTIAAHLYLFHAITPPSTKEPGGYAAAVALHDEDHASKKLDDLFEPHIHEADRPVVTKGPKFS